MDSSDYIHCGLIMTMHNFVILFRLWRQMAQMIQMNGNQPGYSSIQSFFV
jgi:hypothetical protein